MRRQRPRGDSAPVLHPDLDAATYGAISARGGDPFVRNLSRRRVARAFSARIGIFALPGVQSRKPIHSYKPRGHAALPEGMNVAAMFFGTTETKNNHRPTIPPANASANAAPAAIAECANGGSAIAAAISSDM